tara:strand:- start:138 stop:824 length:687 start_codon:yes stop_codon:yes gene_type:complete
MTPEEFHQRADAVLQRAEHYMTEYHLMRLKNFMYKSKQWGNVAEWQGQHLRECETTYSEEFLEEVRAYEANYAEDHRERFRLACQYYRTQGYYSNIIGNVPDDFIFEKSDDYRPPYADYLRMTDNKYFPKIWAAHTDYPKFPAGSMVQVRASSALPQRNPLSPRVGGSSMGWGFRKLAGMHALVLDTSPFKPVSAAKGAKPYKVLVVGHPEPIYIEERFLKRAKGVKR